MAGKTEITLKNLSWVAALQFNMGAFFVRKVFLVIVSALIRKLA
jgi:hypothetical protein